MYGTLVLVVFQNLPIPALASYGKNKEMSLSHRVWNLTNTVVLTDSIIATRRAVSHALRQYAGQLRLLTLWDRLKYEVLSGVYFAGSFRICRETAPKSAFGVNVPPRPSRQADGNRGNAEGIPRSGRCQWRAERLNPLGFLLPTLLSVVSNSPSPNKTNSEYYEECDFVLGNPRKFWNPRYEEIEKERYWEQSYKNAPCQSQ